MITLSLAWPTPWRNSSVGEIIFAGGGLPSIAVINLDSRETACAHTHANRAFDDKLRISAYPTHCCTSTESYLTPEHLFSVAL